MEISLVFYPKIYNFQMQSLDRHIQAAKTRTLLPKLFLSKLKNENIFYLVENFVLIPRFLACWRSRFASNLLQSKPTPFPTHSPRTEHGESDSNQVSSSLFFGVASTTKIRFFVYTLLKTITKFVNKSIFYILFIYVVCLQLLLNQF